MAKAKSTKSRSRKAPKTQADLPGLEPANGNGAAGSQRLGPNGHRMAPTVVLRASSFAAV
jgi:hypothetical protein